MADGESDACQSLHFLHSLPEKIEIGNEFEGTMSVKDPVGREYKGASHEGGAEGYWLVKRAANDGKGKTATHAPGY